MARCSTLFLFAEHLRPILAAVVVSPPLFGNENFSTKPTSCVRLGIHSCIYNTPDDLLHTSVQGTRLFLPNRHYILAPVCCLRACFRIPKHPHNPPHRPAEGYVFTAVRCLRYTRYLILLGWKTCKYYYETDELPNPRPTQPKKNLGKGGIWATFYPQHIIFRRLGLFFVKN